MKPLCVRGEKTAGMIVKEQMKAAAAAEAAKPKPEDPRQVRLRDLLKKKETSVPVAVKPDEMLAKVHALLAHRK